MGPAACEHCDRLQTVDISQTDISEILGGTFASSQLQHLEQSVQAEHNAFFMCDKFERPLWVELLPAEGPDSDAFDEELYKEFS